MIIEQRRTVYPQWFTQEEVSAETILRILEAANLAPTHRLTEPWRFIVFHSHSSKEDLSAFLAGQYLNDTPVEKQSELKLKKLKQKPLQAGAIIIIIMQRDPQLRVPEWEELAATACAVQNLWLKATELGLGGYWSTPVSIMSKPAAQWLGLSDGERCLGMFYLGYHNMPNLPRNRTDVRNKIRWR